MVMSWGTVDDSEFQEWAKEVKTEANASLLKQEVAESTKRVGAQLLKTLKSTTPVGQYTDGRTGGTLRRGWDIQGPSISATGIILTAVNNVEYASYVEEGHRTRGGGGWIEGQFFMKDSFDQVEDQLSRLITPTLQRFLNKLQ